MNKKLLAFITILLFVAMGISGCISDDEPQTVEYIDDTGRTVAIEGTIETIVSLSPANTEILFAIGAGDMIVGDTEYCNYPEEAVAIENVGGYSTVDVERVIELEPDVVFGTTGHEEVRDQLSEAGIPVILFEAVDIERVYDNIRTVGEVMGLKAEADTLVEDMMGTIAEVESDTAGITEKKTVFYMLWNDPPMSAGPNTFIDSVITLAGGTNVAGTAETAWPMYDMETLITLNPDVIILAPHGSSGMTSEQLLSDPDYATISAVVNGNVFELSNGDIILRAGPRIVDAIVEVYGMLYS